MDGGDGEPFLGVVCGLKSEAAAIRAAARRARLHIAISGASASRAEALAQGLCRQGAAAILSVGVSGGLSPDLRTGELLIGQEVRTARDEAFEASASLLAALSLVGKEPPRRAILFGSDEIVATARDKAALYERYGAAAVDMESHGAARAARAAGVPFAAIRAIADPAERALPRAALNAVAPDGSTRAAAVLLACARSPKDFPELIRLGADSSSALKTLRGSLGGLFDRLLFSLDL